MGTTTPNFGFFKPTGATDFVDEVVDLNNNWDLLDAQLTLATQTPFAMANNTVDRSIPNNAATAIDIDAVVEDTLGMINLTTNIFVPSRAGIWKVGCYAQWVANATGVRTIIVQRANPSATPLCEFSIAAPPLGRDPGFAQSMEMRFGGGESIQFQAFQNSGGALGLRGSTLVASPLAMSRFYMRWMRA